MQFKGNPEEVKLFKINRAPTNIRRMILMILDTRLKIESQGCKEGKKLAKVIR